MRVVCLVVFLWSFFFIFTFDLFICTWCVRARGLCVRVDCVYADRLCVCGLCVCFLCCLCADCVCADCCVCVRIVRADCVACTYVYADRNLDQFVDFRENVDIIFIS